MEPDLIISEQTGYRSQHRNCKHMGPHVCKDTTRCVYYLAGFREWQECAVPSPRVPNNYNYSSVVSTHCRLTQQVQISYRCSSSTKALCMRSLASVPIPFDDLHIHVCLLFLVVALLTQKQLPQLLHLQFDHGCCLSRSFGATVVCPACALDFPLCILLGSYCRSCLIFSSDCSC